MPDEELNIVVEELFSYILDPKTQNMVGWEIKDKLRRILKRFEKDVLAELEHAEEDEE